MLGIKKLTATAYHPQTDEQPESYNRTTVTRPQYNAAKNQRDWNEFVQPLTHLYNTQVHKSNGTSRFSMVQTRHQSGPTTVSRPRTLTSSTYVESRRRDISMMLQPRIAALRSQVDTPSREDQA